MPKDLTAGTHPNRLRCKWNTSTWCIYAAGTAGTIQSAGWSMVFERPMDEWSKALQMGRLKLPTDHYFMHKDGTKPPVVQKQQLNHSSKAVAFATKAGVVSTFNAIGSKSVALVIPASDKNRFEHNPDLIITGPFEIIVQDALSSTVYKRQIHLVQLSDEIVFEMPKASYKATAPELKELVLEFDERLINKGFIESLTHKPLETFRRKFADLVPSAASKNINTYSFRVVQVQNPQHRIFQAMCKVPANQRISCLERSGTTEMFIRDFIPRGEEISDITTIPRFWTCDRLSREDALRTAMTITGFTGLVLTRRGIAVRCICGKIAEMRKVLLPNDDRICGLNIAVIPRVVIDSTGVACFDISAWSSKSHEPCCQPTSHPNEVFSRLWVWLLGPLHLRSSHRPTDFLLTSMDLRSKSCCQIPLIKLLNPNQQKRERDLRKGLGRLPKGEKGIFPGRSLKRTMRNSQRITALEAKFTTLEKRQDGLENRINDGFSSVNDQLRQVLNVIAPRGQNDPTGLSPPPKISKTGVWDHVGDAFWKGFSSSPSRVFCLFLMHSVIGDPWLKGNNFTWGSVPFHLQVKLWIGVGFSFGSKQRSLFQVHCQGFYFVGIHGRKNRDPLVCWPVICVLPVDIGSQHVYTAVPENLSKKACNSIFGHPIFSNTRCGHVYSRMFSLCPYKILPRFVSLVFVMDLAPLPKPDEGHVFDRCYWILALGEFCHQHWCEFLVW